MLLAAASSARFRRRRGCAGHRPRSSSTRQRGRRSPYQRRPAARIDDPAGRVRERRCRVKLAGAVNVGRADTAVVAVDHSQSMRGAALNTARGVATAAAARPAAAASGWRSSRSRRRRSGWLPSRATPAAGEKALSEAEGRPALRHGALRRRRARGERLKHEPGTRKVIFLLTDGQGTTGIADIGEAAAAASSGRTSRSTR